MMIRYFKILRNRLRNCDCSLKTWGFLSGWLGVIWRTVATIFLATIISKMTEYDPSIFKITLITALAYVQVSLVANLFFIAGIQKEKPYFTLPYIVVGGIELFMSLFGLMGGVWILHGYNLDYALSFFIPVTILLIGVYFVLWVQTINLFRNMEIEITRKKEDNDRLASIRQSYVNND